MDEATEKTNTLRGRSKIVVKEGNEDVEKEAAAFDAVINSNSPLNMNISAYVTDGEVYKENIQQCRKDENEFRTFVQSIQDEMLAAAEE